MINREKQTDSILKLNNLKILEKALEFKGILTSSQEFWTNNNSDNTNFANDNSVLKEKNLKNSEMRSSFNTNDSVLLNSTYIQTKNSELDTDPFLIDEKINFSKKQIPYPDNSTFCSIKIKQIRKLSEHEIDMNNLSNVNRIKEKNFYENELINSINKHHYQTIKFNKSNNTNNFIDINNDKNSHQVINENKFNNKILINNSKFNNEKRKRKNKIKIEWTRMDDINIIELVEIYNFDWKKIASIMKKPEDLIKQRYEKRLDPKLKFSKFTTEEDNMIISLYKIYGSTWNYISKFFPNRTSIMIKNRFYSCLKKRILSDDPIFNKNSNLKKEQLEKHNSSSRNSENINESEENSNLSINSSKIAKLDGAYKCVIRDPKDLIHLMQKNSPKKKIDFQNDKTSIDLIMIDKNNLDDDSKIRINSSVENKILKKTNEEMNLSNAKMNKEELNNVYNIKTTGLNRKNSLNDYIYHEIDSLSVKSSFNCFFDKIDFSKENLLKESDEIKIFSNLNNANNNFEFEENKNSVYEKITTNLEIDSYNYSSIVNEFLENREFNIKNNQELSYLDSEFLTEEDLIQNVKKINEQKIFIEKILKKFEEEVWKNLDNNDYRIIKINILKKIEFLVQVIRRLKSKIETIKN